MDKFVNRLPTWQTKTYSQAMIAATRKNDKERTSRRSMSQPMPSQQPLATLQTTSSLNTSRNRRLTITSEDLLKILTEPLSPMVGGDGSVHDDDSGLSSSSSNNADQFGLDDPVELGGNEENINPGLKRHNIAGDLSEYVNGTTVDSKLKVSHTKTTSSIPLEAVRSETELAASTTSPRKPCTPLRKLPQLVATSSAIAAVNYPSPQSVSALKSNTMMAHIQRDLNSPSATVRLRAMKALKSPTKSAYANFDVSHTEQQIVTAQDRQVPAEPLSLEELMRNIVVYVEIRSGEDNRSAGVKKVISAMGARVNDKLLRNTTHVIFKDGLLSTYKKAKELNIPIVSILWIEACKNQRQICDPAKFPIANIDRYENPELYDKMKRVKSMQPDSELNKRVRAKPATPKASDTPTAAKKRSPKATTASTASTPSRATTPTTSKVKKTGITKFFKKVTTPSTPEPAAKAAPVAESPATQVLNRMLASKEAATPYRPPHRLPAKDSIDEQIEEDDSAPLQLYEYVVAPEQQSHQQQVTTSELDLFTTAATSQPAQESAAPATDELLAEQASADAAVPKRRMSMRRRSMMADVSTAPPKPEETVSEPQVGSVKRRRSSTLSSLPTPVASANDVCPAGTPRRQTRRRSLCAMPAASKAAEEVAVFKAIAEEEATETETEQTVREILSTVQPLASSSSSQGEEGRGGEKSAHRRRTTFTAQPMEETAGGEESRRTTYAPQEMEESVSQSFITKAASDVMLRRAEEAADSPRNRLPRRETIYTPQQIDEDRLAGGGAAAVRTPQPGYSTLLEEHANMAVFDSTRVPGKRRTLFDVSMDIISRRVETINQKRRQSMVPPPAAVGDELLGTPTASTVTLVGGGQAGDSSTPVHSKEATDKPLENSSDGGGALQTPEPRPKKRKLFTPNDSNLMTPTSSGGGGANNQTLATTPQSAVAKRRTLMPLMQPQSASKAQKPPVAGKQSATHRRRSTMDFEMIGKVSKAAAGENRTKKERPLIVCTNMRKEQIDVIQEALMKLGGFQLEHYVNAMTTHVVSLEPRRTLNMLLGLARGLWILDYSWIVDSLKAHRWLNEEPYELKEFSRAVEICRAERQAFGNSYKCELFRHLGPFYISHRCGTVPKHDLKELILLCCGRVSETRKKAKYILGDVIKRFDDKVYITPFWVLDSITQMQLQKFSLYYCFADDGDANQGTEWKAPVEIFRR